MKVALYNYASDSKTFDIPNFGKVKAMILTIMSGDEVLKVTYQDGSSLNFDSGAGDRLCSFYDGDYFISKKDFRRFCDIGKKLLLGKTMSYERMSEFLHEDDN